MANAYTQYNEGKFEGISKLPLGTLVVCLPPNVVDYTWADVVAAIDDTVFCTRVASICLQVIGVESNPPILTVGCVRGRGRQEPTHPELRDEGDKY